MVLKSIGLFSAGKMLGAIYATIGLILGGFVSLFALVGAGVSQEIGAGAFGALFGIAAIAIFPIMYGFMGFIGGVILALLYNLFAGIVGGIELDLE